MVSAALARDPERVARFEREAKLLASLNHPHIAAIYGRTIAWPKNSAAVAWVGSTATPTNRSEGFQMLGKIVSHYLPSRKNSPVAACGAGLRARENEDAIRG
jgi:serine/threonine protein kinase